MNKLLAGAFCAAAAFSIVSAPTVASAATTINLASIMVPSDPFIKGAEVIKERLDELSDGAFEIKIFDSGQLFPQGAGTDALRRGQIEMADTSMGSYSQALPYTDMFLSAYLFEGVDHARKFWNSELAQKVFEDVAEATNIRTLGTVVYGSRQLSLTKNVDKTVMSPADLKGIKLRMPGPPAWMALGRSLGADPTPIAFNELYLALQTGTVDGQDNTLTVSKAAGLMELTTQVVLTEHQAYALQYAMNEDFWQSLTDEQRGWIQTAVDEGVAHATDLANAAEASLLEEYRKAGARIVEPDKQAFIDHARQFYANSPELNKTWDMELYNAIAAMAD